MPKSTPQVIPKSAPERFVIALGALHVTDVTNASRTMLYDIRRGAWDPWLLELFDIPASLLPEVRPSSDVVASPGATAKSNTQKEA
jgi:glycerol kinase